MVVLEVDLSCALATVISCCDCCLLFVKYPSFHIRSSFGGKARKFLMIKGCCTRMRRSLAEVSGGAIDAFMLRTQLRVDSLT